MNDNNRYKHPIYKNAIKITTLFALLLFAATTISSHNLLLFVTAQKDPQAQITEPPKPPKEEKNPTCSEGFTLKDGVCTQPAPDCPMGTDPVNGGAQCQAPQAPATDRCPTGTEFSNGQCQTAAPDCPAGTQPVNGGAQCQAPAPAPIDRCAAGTQFSNGQCQTQATCPAGFSPNFDNPKNPKCKKVRE